MKRYREPGFTLIELLIVVAIIAILAAIAVPNFLEAQTRAKVSRAKADMRTFAVAVESYQVDWNKPPFSATNVAQGVNASENLLSANWPPLPSPLPPFYQQYRFWQCLTTPISYIGGPLYDPFRSANDLTSTGEARSGLLFYDTTKFVGFGSKGAGGSVQVGGPFFRNTYRKAFEKGGVWFIASQGPMKASWWVGFGRPSPLNQLGPLGVLAEDVTPLGWVSKVDSLYDPTNGTMSFGFIMRSNKGQH